MDRNLGLHCACQIITVIIVIINHRIWKQRQQNKDVKLCKTYMPQLLKYIVGVRTISSCVRRSCTQCAPPKTRFNRCKHTGSRTGKEDERVRTGRDVCRVFLVLFSPRYLISCSCNVYFLFLCRRFSPGLKHTGLCAGMTSKTLWTLKCFSERFKVDSVLILYLWIPFLTC